MSRYSDIDPQDIDPETGRPYAGYSSPSLDTSFHDGEADVEDDADGDEVLVALHQYRNDLLYPPTGGSIGRRLAMIDALIAKAGR